MRHDSFARHTRRACSAGALATLVAAPCLAQTPAAPATVAPATSVPATAAEHAAHAAAPPALAPEDAAALARVAASVAQVRDSAQKQLSLGRNKTAHAQQQLRQQAAAQVAALLRQANLSDAEYRRRTYLVSTDTAARRAYDAAVAKLTGAPLPGQGTAGAAATLASAPPAATAPPPALPAGPLGAHLGHLLEAFTDTPMGHGLIPTALAEARTAAVHAGLAARDPNDLAAMKLHAGHVLHAVDPTAASSGPGLGYGVKRAALAAAAHAEMAGAVPGAAPQVPQHAGHVGAAARNTVRRADTIVALARRVQGASTAAEAAPLVSQLVALATELTDGRDANTDGRVDTSEAEAGLHQADEHARLLAASAR